LVGVVICGRPVAKGICKRTVLEVNRCATDGTRNACSWLYAAAARVATQLGFTAVITYTLAREDGASLRACGWWDEMLAERDTDWDCEARGRGRQVDMFREPHARGTKLGKKRRWLWLTGIDRAALPAGEK
jgi:hypothetical protein